jgi:hypothetical protein
MVEYKQNEAITKISLWISERLDKYEIILAIAFLVFLFLNISGFLFGGTLMTLMLSTLAVFYFYKAFAPLEEEKAIGFDVFINKVVYFALSIGIIGILFRLQSWTGYDVMLQMACVLLAIGFVFIVYIKSKKPELRIFPSRLILRVLVVLVFGVLLHFTPRENLIKLKLIKEMRIPQTEQGFQSDVSFEQFFKYFSNDSIFQLSRVQFPFKYQSLNDDGKIDDTVIKKSDWKFISFSRDSIAYKKEFDKYKPVIKLLGKDSVNYIQEGIDNGIHIEYKFVNIENKWLLAKIFDKSN